MPDESDRKIEKLFELDLSHHDIGSLMKNDAIKRVAEAYEANVRRVQLLIAMLPNIAIWSGNFQRFMTRADIATYGLDVSEEDRSKDPELVKRRSQDFQTQHATEQQRLAESPSYLEQSTRMAIGNLIALSQMFPGMVTALDTVMASVVIGSWTAFEVLAGDLWEAAINARPCRLTMLDGDPKIWQNGNSPDDEQQSGAKSVDRSISLGFLQGHFRTLGTTMGTMLRPRFSFQTVPVIRKAYGLAFAIDFLEVHKALTHTAIDHLAGLRNALVHKAGKADPKFKAQTHDCAHFSAVKPKEQIRLDGEIVPDVTTKAVRQAVELIAAVDRWLDAHPEVATDA